MKTSLGFYEITYHQGTRQVKELINREDYEVYRQLSDKKSDISSKLKGKNKNKKDPKLVAELSKVSNELKDFSYPFFVVGSPIYDGIETGILSLPSSQGGDTPIKVIKIDKFASGSSVEDIEDDE